MKNILTIFTGGTICTTIKNGVMNTDRAASAALIDFFKKSNSPYKTDVNIEQGKFFGILSENMTVDTWNAIIAHFIDNMHTISKYDGVIIAHGTDTLAYTTSLFSILLRGFGIPVIFVSANYSIVTEDGEQNPISNGIDNYTAAIECICRNIVPGVYATYKNPEDGRMYLHNGGHLIQCRIYDDNFYSRDAIDITDSDNVDLSGLWASAESNTNDLPIMKLRYKKLTNCILKISPYTGLNYDMFNLDCAKAVLHGTYHSGTSCVVRTAHSLQYENNNSSVLAFFDRCANRDKPIPFYYSPCRTGNKFNVYASVPYIETHTANNQRPVILYGQTDELVYVKLLFAYSIDLPKDKIQMFLDNE